MNVDAKALAEFCATVLTNVGLSADHADIVADSLVDANLRGVDTHGVVRLPIYVQRMEMGLIATQPQVRVERTGASTAIFDGGNGPGQVVAFRAMEEAIALANDAGTGFVAVRNSNHFGTAGYHAMRALDDDMIGIVVSHAEADVVPFGGRTPKLGTNPIAIAVPTGEYAPIVLDMATSIVAMGHVLLAAKEGRPIPDNWAVDEDGTPVTNPEKARAVRPMAGAKGYGLAVIVDVLSALLTGASFGVHVNRMYDNFSEPQAIGHFVGAIDVARYVSVDTFKKRIDRMIRELKSTPPVEGVEEVLLPGEPEQRTEANRRRDGIPLSREVYTELRELGQNFGVDLDDAAVSPEEDD